MLMSFAHSELAFDATYLLGIGLGIGLCYVPAMGAVQAVCLRCPALAGGLAASGIGVGTLVEPSLAHRAVEYLGWRGALQMMSLLGVGGMLAAFLLLPRNVHAEANRAVLRFAVYPKRTDQHRNGRNAALLYLAQLLVSVVVFVPFAHLVLFARARGLSVGTGAGLIGLIGLGSLTGRLLLSWVAERLGSCRAAAVCTTVVALALIGFAGFSRPWELGCDAVLYGLGYGGVIALLAPVVTEILGPQKICRSLGLVTTSRGLGILLGPWAVGVMAHRTSSYALPFLMCAALALCAALLFDRLYRQRHPVVRVLSLAPASGSG
jgi:MFS transporter, OFA family, oxalate/formate antiporter